MKYTLKKQIDTFSFYSYFRKLDMIYVYIIPYLDCNFHEITNRVFTSSATRASNLQEAKLFIVGQTECERAYEREGSLSHLQLSYPSLLQRSDVICAAAPNRDACQVRSYSR